MTDAIRISRRRFMKTAALGAASLSAAGGLAACRSSQDATGATAQETTWDEEFDVIVCGGGGAGIAAAYSALENGAEKVVIIEKANQCGGTTSINLGNIMAAGTTLQKEAGIVDDTGEAMAAWWIAEGEGVADERLVRNLADASADNLEWMAENFGVAYANLYGAYGTPYLEEGMLKDRIHVIVDAADPTKAGGVVWTTNGLAAFADKGGQVMTATEVTGLAMVDGEVVGVECGKARYRAKRGVVLAMGGVDRSEELAARYLPQQLSDIKRGGVFVAQTNTGDGIRIGLAAGARGAFYSSVALFYEALYFAANSNPELASIIVNQRGLRFMREDTTYGYYGRVAYEEAAKNGGDAGTTWMILDTKMIASPQGAWSDTAEGGAEARAAAIESGALMQADSIDELARLIGVDADTLSETVARWNKDAAAGIDTLFGREKQLGAIDEAPYYAWKVAGTNIGAVGGLVINDEAAVTDQDGKAIPRLFAAGTNSAGWLGRTYPGSGAFLAGCLHWGRIAGRSAAQA